MAETGLQSERQMTMKLSPNVGQRAATLNANDSGSVSVEYIILLTVVALGVCSALALLGIPLLLLYEAQTTWLALGLL